MARYAYDVNTTQRYIDVHKQFQGGLKTVDTDDALGAVFLRQAENVSLSEFGFIEKRYGTYENFKIQKQGNLQGYWEFSGYSVYAVNNILYYYKDGVETAVTSISQENSAEWRYPTLPVYDGSGFGVQTTYRDMNAVNINNVLYIFTGYYPVYVKIVNSVPTFYWFSVTIPSYDEIVVTGHNLLEDNYNTAYKYTTSQTGSMTPDSTISAKNKIDSIKFNPSIPFVVDENGNKGSIEFNVDYTLVSSLALNYPSLASQYKRLSLKSVGFRRSGSGATTFTPVDITDVDFEDIDNANDTTVRETLDGGFLVNKKDLISSQLLRVYTGVNEQQRYVYTVEVTNNFSKEAITRGDKMVYQFFKKTGDSNDPYDKILFSEFHCNPNDFGSTPNDFNIEITPKDSSGNAFTDAVVISSSNITTTNDHYEFTIPSTLSTNDSVATYDITFNHTFVQATQEITCSGYGDELVDYTDFVQTLAKVNELSSVRNFSNTVGQRPLVDFSITDLLSGTYDFEIVYELKNYTSLDGLFDLHSSETFSGIAYEVPITVEKLQDFPGITDDFLPKLKPIWTCNKVIEHFGKLMVWGSLEMPATVFYSFPDRPTFFPSKFYLDFQNDENTPVQAVSSYMNILVVQTEDRTWGVRGNSGLLDSPAPYTPFTINPTVGTIAYKSVRPVRNHLFFLSKQGVIALKSLYAADEQYNIEFVDRNIRNIVPQDTQAVGIQFDNQYWLNFPNFGITLRWYIDKKAWVQDKYGAWDDFNGVFKYQIKDGKLEFITHPSRFPDSGNLYIYKIGVDDSLPTDLFIPIFAKFETSFLNQNFPFHPKNYKETKLDFTLQNEYNLGRVAFYDSVRDGGLVKGGSSGNSGIALTVPSPFIKNHKYRVEFYDTENVVTHIPLTSILIEGVSGYASTPTPVGTETCSLNPETNTTEALCTAAGGTWAVQATLIWEFTISNNYSQDANSVDFVTNITNTDFALIESVTIRDVSYDDSLVFKTWVISEDQTLNIDNYEGYDQATADVNLDLTLKDRLGDWVFGESDFGNKVTAVKTIKLSGKGYNSKLYVEDLSKSKWTLESVGITYKMKRARSR